MVWTGLVSYGRDWSGEDFTVLLLQILNERYIAVCAVTEGRKTENGGEENGKWVSETLVETPARVNK